MYHSAVNVGLQNPEANNRKITEKSKFHRRFKLRNGFCCFNGSAEDSSETESVMNVENGNYDVEGDCENGVGSGVGIGVGSGVGSGVGIGADQSPKTNFTPNYHIFNWIWWWPVFLWLEKHSTNAVMDFEVQPLLIFSKQPVQTSFSQRKINKLGYKNGGIKNHQA